MDALMAPNMAIAAEVDTAPAPDSYRDLLLKFKVLFVARFILFYNYPSCTQICIGLKNLMNSVTLCKQLDNTYRVGILWYVKVKAIQLGGTG